MVSTMWRLVNLVTTPVVPSGYLDMVAPLRSGAELRARVMEVRPETRDAVTLVLKPGADWLGHRPGQYIRVGIDVEGVRRWRAYSLTSRPGQRTISITVKAITDGVVSNHLVRRARPGQLLHIDQATGDFTLPERFTPEVSTPLLFITAGSGITPVMGMLRSLTSQPLPSQPLGQSVGQSVRQSVGQSHIPVLIHSAPSPDDVIFGAELRWLAEQRRITLIERHTDRDGLLRPDELRGLVPDLADRLAWACGPTVMVDALIAQWESWGLADRLRTERFRPSATAAQSLAAGNAASSAAGTLRLSDGREISADPSRPILDVAEEAGVLMKSGCRMGICFGCVVPLRSGAVRDLRDGQVISAVEGDGVRIQPCISAVAGECVIETSPPSR